MDTDAFGPVNSFAPPEDPERVGFSPRRDRWAPYLLLHQSKDVGATKAARRGSVALPFFSQFNRFSTITNKKR